MAKWSEILSKLMGSNIITVDESGQKTISQSDNLDEVDIEGLSIFEPIVEPETTTETTTTTIPDLANINREELAKLSERIWALENLVRAVDEVNAVTDPTPTSVEEW